MIVYLYKRGSIRKNGAAKRVIYLIYRIADLTVYVSFVSRHK